MTALADQLKSTVDDRQPSEFGLRERVLSMSTPEDRTLSQWTRKVVGINNVLILSMSH